MHCLSSMMLSTSTRCEQAYTPIHPYACLGVFTPKSARLPVSSCLCFMIVPCPVLPATVSALSAQRWETCNLGQVDQAAG